MSCPVWWAPRRCPMTRTQLLQELRQMRFEEAYGGWQARRLTQEEAARLLGVCERTFRRYVDRYEDEGFDGLVDKLLSQVSAQRAHEEGGSRSESRPKSSMMVSGATCGRRSPSSPRAGAAGSPKTPCSRPPIALRPWRPGLERWLPRGSGLVRLGRRQGPSGVSADGHRDSRGRGLPAPDPLSGVFVVG